MHSLLVLLFDELDRALAKFMSNKIKLNNTLMLQISLALVLKMFLMILIAWRTFFELVIACFICVCQLSLESKCTHRTFIDLIEGILLPLICSFIGGVSLRWNKKISIFALLT